MSDPTVEQARTQAKRGKSSVRKRPHEGGRPVFDGDGRIVAVLNGPNVTDADVDQARALVAWMPTYTGGGNG